MSVCLPARLYVCLFVCVSVCSVRFGPFGRSLIHCFVCFLGCFFFHILIFFRLAANLLRILCSDSNTREQVKVYEGIRICLRYLEKCAIRVIWKFLVGDFITNSSKIPVLFYYLFLVYWAPKT